MGSTKLIPARPPIRWLTDYLGGSYRTKPEVIQAGPYPSPERFGDCCTNENIHLADFEDDFRL